MSEKLAIPALNCRQCHPPVGKLLEEKLRVGGKGVNAYLFTVGDDDTDRAYNDPAQCDHLASFAIFQFN